MDDIERARSALSTLDPGCNRETWVKTAMAAKAAGLTLDDFIDWSTPAENFGGERECTSVWKSIDVGPVGAGSLFYMATAVGWPDPLKRHQTRHNGHTGNPDTLASRSRMTSQTKPKTDPATVWNRLEPASVAHPYIAAKQGRADGLRVVPPDDPLTIRGVRMGGWLAVPVMSDTGEVVSLQFIAPPDAARELKSRGIPGKLNLPGEPMAGTFIVGELTPGGVAYLVEGIGTAWACWKATGRAGVVCFGWGSVKARAGELRQRDASAALVIVPDVGKEADATAIAREVGAKVAPMPDGWPRNSDICDLALRDGFDAAEAILASAKEPPPEGVAIIRTSIAADLAAGPDVIDNAEPPREIVHQRLYVAGANLAGVGGAGKTTVALNEYVHITCGGKLYGADVVKQGPCILVTAEDGAGHPRYILRRILEDGIASGALTERAAQRAKESIKVIAWSRSAFGPITNVDRDGNVWRAPAFDVLLELIAPLSPAVVTLDPSALFSPGERFGNDGEAFLASMVHESALSIGCTFQILDHVSQAVAMSGMVHQHAARGATAKTDNARLARQLVKFKPGESDATGQPAAVVPEDIADGRILQLHWTKSNYGPIPPFAWLRRAGYWVEHLRAARPEEIEAQRRQAVERRAEADTRAVVDAVRAAVLRGEKPAQSQIEDAGALDANGRGFSRQRIRTAIARAIAGGHLRYVDLPENERRGARTQYLLPTGMTP